MKDVFFAVGKVVCGLAFLSFPVLASPSLPLINTNNIINITSAPYNAVGDGVTVNTTAIQNAINAATLGGTTNGLNGGTVKIPSGVFLSGPLTMANSVDLHVDSGATLLMLPSNSWPSATTPFINGSGLHDIEISGTGTINGQGATWWGPPKAASRPNFINFSGCTRILIEDVTSLNPPTFHFMLKGNNLDLTLQNLNIIAPGNSPNTDGMDLASVNVLVQNCYISTGDDNIEIGGSGSILANLLVTNCTFGTGHGVSMGSITSGGVSNVTVVNCTFNGTDYGIRLKSDNAASGGGSGGLCQNIGYYNIGMNNIRNGAVVIYSYYNEFGTPTSVTPTFASTQIVAAVTSKTIVWRNITISNLTATVTNSGGVAGIIWARIEMPATNILLQRVNITAPKTFGIYNAQNVQFIDSKITPTNSGQKTFAIWNANVIVSNSVPATNVVTFDGLGGNTNDSLALYYAPASMTSTDLFGINPLTLSGSILTNSGDLTLTSSDVVNFALGTNTSRVVVNGLNLTLNSTIINITNAPGFTVTNYTLFKFISGHPGSPILGTTPTAFPNYSYSLNNLLAGQLLLVVTPPSSPNIGNIHTTSDGSGVIVSGTGGATNGIYYVLTSTNIALPFNQWSPVSTNPFDGSGNFIFTNAIGAGKPQQFYLLQLP